MDIRNTVRRAAAVVAVAAPLALVASPASAQDVTAEDTSTTISGTAWLDQNSDGIRDAGEPRFAGQTMYLVGTNTAVQTDASGRYTFTGLRAGQSYRVGSMDRSLLDGHGWSSNRSHLPNGSDFSADEGQATFYAGEQNADSGLVLVRNDHRVWQIVVNRPAGSKPTYEVGDVLEIVGVALVLHDAHDQIGGKLILPEGLRKLERIGIPAFYAEDKANEVTGYWYERRSPQYAEYIGAKVIVEKPIDAAEIKMEVWKGVFGKSDPDLSNDTMTRSFTAVAAPTTNPVTT
jgi:hypothetical protein